MAFTTGVDDGGQASLGVGSTLPSPLMDLLDSEEIQPGVDPSYQLCKVIYTYHPLGAKMASAPINMAQSQERELAVPGGPEDDLIAAFKREWKAIGGVGADVIIHNTMKLARVYGISSLIVGAKNFPSDKPLPLDKIHEMDLYFNVADPLNTAGSLVLSQDPNSPDFQRATRVRVANQEYHPSRCVVMMNEEPVYIEFTNSAFGFVGRSVYQRALYPLKSYVQSMITDDSVTQKAGLLVAKLKAPGSVIDQRSRSWWQFKRTAIKGATTGNVVSVGIDENIESIDLKNLRDAAEFARNNILKNIATAADMPASMINQETLAEGFGEGQEDAKQIARYIDRMRIEMSPLYTFFDSLVMHRAWNPDFYATIQTKYKQYKDIPYETAFYSWKNAFEAQWPNLLVEPDSEKVKVDETIMKAAIAVVEVLQPMVDPENKATLAAWLADVMSERKQLFSSPLNLDEELIASYVPPTPEREPEPIPESYET